MFHPKLQPMAIANTASSWVSQIDIQCAIMSALREDAQQRGHTVSSRLRWRLNDSRGCDRAALASRSLQSLTALGSKLMPHVRIHANARSSLLANELGTLAFCWGRDIYLNAIDLDRVPLRTWIAVVWHEAAHIASQINFEKIRCWDGPGHSTLTKMAVEQFKEAFQEMFARKNVALDWTLFTRNLGEETNSRDHTGRLLHCSDTFKYIVGGWFPYTFSEYVPLLFCLRPISDLSDALVRAGLPKALTMFSKGEGPEHGEGMNYVFPDIEINRHLNVQVEEQELRAALDAYLNAQGRQFADRLEKHLGNLLHTTQDRASHREGRKGYGHNDPRCANGWEADDPHHHDHMAGGRSEEGNSWWICSVAAYRQAYNNSCELLERFFQSAGVTYNTNWLRKVTSCSPELGDHLPALTLQDSQFWPNVSVPAGASDCRYGCVTGQRKTIE